MTNRAVPVPTSPIDVLLVDDHQLMREGLRLTLARQPDLRIVGEAGDGKTALEMADRLKPSVIVLDIGLPDVDGVTLSGQILGRFPKARVVLLTAVLDQAHLDRAMSAGVSGYVLKVNGSEELVRAIRKAVSGEIYLSPEVTSVLLDGYKRLRETHAVKDAVLTDREKEVLKLIAEGRNTKEIAADLGLSVKTVETHRVRILGKLALNSVADLTKYAIRMGYTTV